MSFILVLTVNRGKDKNRYNIFPASLSPDVSMSFYIKYPYLGMLSFKRIPTFPVKSFVLEGLLEMTMVS